MKLIIKTILLSSILLFVSCNKSKRACTTIAEPKPTEHLVSDSDLNLAKELLNSANIDYSNFQIYRAEKSFTNSYHVRCNQFINGLELFTDELNFHFDENKNYVSMSGDSVTTIALDNQSKMSENELKDLYFEQIKNDPYVKDRINKIARNCIKLQFGYYDLNATKGNAKYEYVKAWKITPLKNDKPILFVNDTSGETIRFFGGVIVN